jgi:hypothetical protein
MKDTRYPYTYAYDYVRSLAGYTKGSTKLSRADAAQICLGIAKALHTDHKALTEQLAAFYKEHEEEITEHDTEVLLSQIENEFKWIERL